MKSTHFDIFMRAVEEHAGDATILRGRFLVVPPCTDFGYACDPSNALTFASLGVDGVHYAIVQVDAEISDYESPVIEISPMDSEQITVLADSFVSYLAISCGASRQEMEAILAKEQRGAPSLVTYLREHFDHSRLVDEERLTRLKRLRRLVKASPLSD